MPMDDNASREIYRLLNSPHHWHAKANKLKHCATLLFDAFIAARNLSEEEQFTTQDTEIDDVATLLFGLAMENLLKAALLKKSKVQIDVDGNVAWKSVQGARIHDLLGMCRPLKFLKLDASQEKLMERLSAFVCWAGKYPTPLERIREKDFQGFHISNQPKAAKVMTPFPFEIEDKQMFEDIYKTISDKIFPSRSKSS